MAQSSREYMRLWRERNPQRCRRYRQNYRRKSPEHHILATVRGRAKKYGLPFNLELSDIVIPYLCPVLGIPIIKGNGFMVDSSPSLDRLVPELGYIKGNVEIMSMRSNRIKNDGTASEHEAIAEYIRRKTLDCKNK